VPVEVRVVLFEWWSIEQTREARHNSAPVAHGRLDQCFLKHEHAFHSVCPLGSPAATRIMQSRLKIPISVLVVIHTPQLEVLLLERADHPGFWQSVTGSQSEGETLEQTAVRELAEETGLDAAEHRLWDWQLQNRYEIFPEWRWRYPPGVTENTEHVFGLQISAPIAVRIAPREHLAFAWLPWQEAAQRCFSWSNAAAIRELPNRIG